MTSVSVWVITIVILLAVLAFDLALAVKNRSKVTSTKEAGIWISIYILGAIIFGATLDTTNNPASHSEFFAGWLTEYSLSVDNVFVFIIILTKLKIDKTQAQLVLLWGIIMALVLRGAFIAAGAALINRFIAIFFVFGVFLLYTAWHLATEKAGNDEEQWKENKLISYLRAKGASTFKIALVAVGTTDLLFALDSIPAIFGLTKDPYIVFTANAFALMGLRQLYFLLGDFLNRLIYLSKGLSIILGFIGVKLIIEALHGIGVHDILGLHIPEVSLAVSLGVIGASLGVTTLVSLAVTSKRN